MVLSAGQFSVMNTPGGIFSLVRMQAIAAVIGFAGLLIMANGIGSKKGGRYWFGHHFLADFAFPIYVVTCIGGLVAVLLLGTRVQGGLRWIQIPAIGVQFQPSEFAKVGMIIMLARYIGADRTRADFDNPFKVGLKRFFISLRGLLGCVVIIGIPAGLVAAGRNMSTVLIMVGIGAAMIFLASRYFFSWLIAGASAVGAGVLYLYTRVGVDFRGGRFAAWGDPFSDPLGYGYHAIQSLFAIASGGFFGLGLGNSNQKMRYLPEAHNDFIFAIIVEELGLFGASLLLMFFGILVWRGCLAAIRARSLEGTLMATGIIAMISIQVLINVGVVTNTLPNTGIPLPFISYGGTSLIVMLSSVGILLNISKYPRNRT